MPSSGGDLRAGQSWSKAQRAKNHLLWLSATLSLTLVRALPRRWVEMLGRGVGKLAYLALPRARRQAERNLTLCLPQLEEGKRAELVARNFITLGENLADTVALLDARDPPERTLALPPASVSVLEGALAQGNGVIYVTAHLGPWERMAAVLAAHDFPISTIARESYDPRFDRLYDRLRRPRGIEALYRGRESTPLAIVRALLRNRVVGFPVDLPGRVPTLPVKLLGQASKLPIGPARIALRRGAPLVLGTPAPGDGGRLEIRIAPLSTEGLLPTAAGEAALLQRIADALGERIMALPAHWPWMHPSFEATRLLTPLRGVREKR